MTIAFAYTFLLEAAVLAALFATLWLSFWIRDCHRRIDHQALPTPLGHAPAFDLARPQQGFREWRLSGRTGIFSRARFPLEIAPRDGEPAGEQDQAVLYRPEHVQHFSDKPQIQGEQHQHAQLKPMDPDPVIHSLPHSAAAFTPNPDGLVR